MSDDIRSRLRNWARWCRLDMGGPDSSCANPLYQMMVYRDDDGYGEVTELTVVVPTDYAPRPEFEDINEPDAEYLDGLITALAQSHRAVLSVRYVLRLPCKTPEAKDRLTAAITALEMRMETWREAVNG